MRTADELQGAVLSPDLVERKPNRHHLLALDRPKRQIVVERGTLATAGSNVEHLIVEQVELLRPGQLGRNAGHYGVEAEVSEHLVVLPDPKFHEVLVGASIGHQLYRGHVLAGLSAPNDPLVFDYLGKMCYPVAVERFELRLTQGVWVPADHRFSPVQQPYPSGAGDSRSLEGDRQLGGVGTHIRLHAGIGGRPHRNTPPRMQAITGVATILLDGTERVCRRSNRERCHIRP